MFSSKDQNKLKRLLESAPPPPKRIKPRDRSQELATKSRQRLAFSRFRALNEYLYSHTSSEANTYLTSQRFNTYHKTYEEIVKKWPQKPIDVIIKRLESKKNVTIADIGCGNRPLIKEAFPSLTVHSFDLVSTDPNIVATDMTLLPLSDKSIDICIYCLSLMSTNLNQCLREANRVLSTDGTLIICEVISRFDSKQELFIKQMKSLGFQLSHSEGVTDFFILFEFRKYKSLKSYSKLPDISLKPCFYKLR